MARGGMVEIGEDGEVRYEASHQGENFETSDKNRGDNQAHRTSMRNSTVADIKSSEDALGFKPYVDAIAAFLSNEDTQFPLTMSVEGKWGSGKSSFMAQLEKALKNRNGHSLFVNFNAWRHDKDEEIWAAFALDFIKQVKSSLTLRERLSARIGTYFARLKLSAVIELGFFIILAFASLGFVNYFGISAVEQLFGDQFKDWSDAGKKFGNFLGFSSGAVGTIGAAWFLLKFVREHFKTVISHDLSHYIEKPDYESKKTFIAKFHEDFEIILSHGIPGKNRKVYVFIDDLDRCSAPRAAELMQAFNLMMPEKGKIAFILGMDREKVAAGIACKHAEILKYLDEGASAEDVSTGYRYGTTFIEKFIQISFTLPRPAIEERKAYIQHILGVKRATEEAAPPLSGWLEKLKSFFKTTINKSQMPTIFDPAIRTSDKEQVEQEKKKKLAEFEMKIGPETPEMHDIVEMASHALDDNPRRVKQFVNLFRLRAYISYETGLLSQHSDAEAGLITLAQLGKYIVLSMQWPQFVVALEDNSDLLNKLLNDSEVLRQHPGMQRRGGENKEVDFWIEKTKLVDLLLYSPPEMKAGVETYKYLMNDFDVSLLLRTAKKIRTIKINMPNTSDSINSLNENSLKEEAESQLATEYYENNEMALIFIDELNELYGRISRQNNWDNIPKFKKYKPRNVPDAGVYFYDENLDIQMYFGFGTTWGYYFAFGTSTQKNIPERMKWVDKYFKDHIPSEFSTLEPYGDSNWDFYYLVLNLLSKDRRGKVEEFKRKVRVLCEAMIPCYIKLRSEIVNE